MNVVYDRYRCQFILTDRYGQDDIGRVSVVPVLVGDVERKVRLLVRCYAELDLGGTTGWQRTDKRLGGADIKPGSFRDDDDIFDFTLPGVDNAQIDRIFF